MCIWGLIIFLFELLISRSRTLRKWFRGDTDILITDGKIDHKCLKDNRLEMDEIASVAREKGVFDFSSIKNLYIESDGGFTIETYKYPYPISEKNHSIYPIIKNHSLNTVNLKRLNKNEEWLLRQLSKRGINRIEDVFYADWSDDRGLFILQYKSK